MEKYTFKCKDCGSTKYKKDGNTYTCLYCGYSEEVHFNSDGSVKKLEEVPPVQEQSVTTDAETSTVEDKSSQKKEKSFGARLVSAIFNDKLVMLLVCLFFGVFGVHKFVEGKIGWGLFYLCTLGLFGIGYVVNLIQYATNYISTFVKIIAESD